MKRLFRLLIVFLSMLLSAGVLGTGVYLYVDGGYVDYSSTGTYRYPINGYDTFLQYPMDSILIKELSDKGYQPDGISINQEGDYCAYPTNMTYEQITDAINKIFKIRPREASFQYNSNVVYRCAPFVYSVRLLLIILGSICLFITTLGMFYAIKTPV